MIISDGFTGNIALKSIEGTARLVLRLLKNSVKKSLLAKLGLPFMLGVALSLKKRWIRACITGQCLSA